MILEVSEDKEFLRILDCTTQEYNQVKLSFVKKTKNYKYSPLFKKGLWDGNISFYKGNLIPSGMYDYLKSEMSKIGSCVKISGFDRLIDKELTEDTFNEWCDIFFEGTDWNPRDYQRNAAYRILKMKHCLAQLATSAGKTLISFMVFAYLLDNKLVDKILMVVPNIGLVVQGAGDFMEYNTDKLPLKIQQMYAGAKYDDNTNIIIGTYQTLVKQGKDFFSQFQCCFVDECHLANSASEIKILEQCKTDYKFGLSGTIPSNLFADGLTLLSNFGPIVVNITAKELQDKGFISSCNITQVELNYVTQDQRNKFINAANILKKSNKQTELFALEKKFVSESEIRLKTICNIIAKSDKNSLVLFHHIEYGKKIYDILKQTGKQIYHIDSSTSMEMRESIREMTELKNNVIVVASFGTCSTGMNIKNLFNLYLVESFKSPTVVLQSIGRLLRMNEAINKNHAEIIDFCDVSLYPNCYMYRHAIERRTLYKNQQFPVKIITI